LKLTLFTKGEKVKMALYVTKLSEKEWEELEEMIGEENQSIPANRATIVLLSENGVKVPEIAREVGLHPINVRKWIHRFNTEGVEGLKSGKSPGRPPVFTFEQREQIVAIKTEKPEWSLAKLQRHLIEQGIVEEISLETIRQIVNKKG